MEEDPTLKPTEKAEASADEEIPYKNKNSGIYHTFLETPIAKAQRAAMRSLAIVPKVPQYV
jgi:hypothetical protein